VIEFVLLAAGWIAFLLFVARKGTRHLLAKHVGYTLPVAGGVGGALLEALPTTPVSPGFTVRTVIAVLAGVFAGRLFARLARLWAEGQERRAATTPPARPPRLVHPMIAAGMLLAGLPTLWHVLTSEHALLEELTTPRDAQTGVVHGCGEVRVEKAAPAAALLLHGLYGSPADFADLPARLAAAGFDVVAPLLPGHGRVPDDVDAVWAEDYRKAARAAYDDVAATHPRVAVVGFGMGGALALVVAAERKPSAVVLANPYLGRLATPQLDALVGPVSRMARRVLGTRDVRGRGYVTRSLHALRQARDLGKAWEDAAAVRVSCPALVLVGASDREVSTPFALAWSDAALKTPAVSLAASGHDLFHESDAQDAIERTTRFLEANAR
jgi:carboxylesterase